MSWAVMGDTEAIFLRLKRTRIDFLLSSPLAFMFSQGIDPCSFQL